MGTSSKAQAAAKPLKSGKGMSGSSTGPNDGNPNYGSGGGNAPKPGNDHGPGGKGKKGKTGKG